MTRKQCKACPWKVSTVPEEDIPGGYCETKHENLRNTVKSGLSSFASPLRMMACHETTPGKDIPCVGWLHNQLTVGNNLALRMRTLEHKELLDYALVGPQHATLEDTLPKNRGSR